MACSGLNILHWVHLLHFPWHYHSPFTSHVQLICFAEVSLTTPTHDVLSAVTLRALMGCTTSTRTIHSALFLWVMCDMVCHLRVRGGWPICIFHSHIWVTNHLIWKFQLLISDQWRLSRSVGLIITFISYLVPLKYFCLDIFISKGSASHHPD